VLAQRDRCVKFTALRPVKAQALRLQIGEHVAKFGGQVGFGLNRSAAGDEPHPLGQQALPQVAAGRYRQRARDGAHMDRRRRIE
jgi:hypothetical protein